MNIDNCEKWFKNKNINPLTKRKIQSKKATYNKIEKECEEIIEKRNNVAAIKITNLFKPLLHKYSGDIKDRINYYKILTKYLKDYKTVSKNNCLKNYKQKFFRIGKRIIINKKLGEGVYGIVFNAYFRPDIKNKEYGKALKMAVKLSEYTIENQKEADIYEKISKYVIQNKCPHFSIFYGVLLCDTLDLTSDDETESSSLINSQSKQSLNINKYEYNNLDLFQKKEYFLTLTELADGTLYNFLISRNLKKFIYDNYKIEDTIENNYIIKYMKLDIKYNCVIQCMMSIVFFHKLMKYSHDDSHFNNYLFHKIKPGGYFHYNIYGVDYYLKNVGVIIILNDFGLIEKLTLKNLHHDFIFLSNGIENLTIINFIKKNIFNEINNNNKKQKTYLDFIKKSNKQLSLEQLEDKIYPNIFKELSKLFPQQLLIKKPKGVIINKIPYSI
jgi:hypothetical protein